MNPETEDIIPSLEACRTIARMNKFARKNKPYVTEKEIRWASEKGDYCIYCLCENEKRVRYIGITNQLPSTRLAQHFSDCGRGKNTYKENWLRKCIDSGIPVTIRMVRDGLTADRAGLMEAELIRFFKKAFNLTNTHSGGATGYAGLSEESKQKHRKAMRELCGEPVKKEILPPLKERRRPQRTKRQAKPKPEVYIDAELGF
jgi:hypothetical protein